MRPARAAAAVLDSPWVNPSPMALALDPSCDDVELYSFAWNSLTFLVTNSFFSSYHDFLPVLG